MQTKAQADLTGKRLLILGGTRISCEIVRIARQLGCYIGVADYNSVQKSPAKQIADAAYDVSVRDLEAMTDLIRREKYDGVTVGFADAILADYADICEAAGLPAYATRPQLEMFTQKDKYKQLLRKYGIPTVDEYAVDLNDFDRSTEDIRYPVLVKPADSAGARGITICRDKESLRNAIEKAKGFSHTGVVLVERYIEGREVTINWVFKDGKYYLTCIGNRHVKHNQDGVIPLPVGYTYPAAITPTFRRDYEEKCKEMFRSQGLTNGMMFMQCKVENGIPVIYDIGFRMTGTLEYINLENACGFNPIEMMIRFALTGSMGEPDLASKVDPLMHGRYGFNVSCLSAPGKIGTLSGREEVLKFPEVNAAVVAHYPGEEITQNMKGLLAQICIRILGTVDSEEELYPAMKKVNDTIRILSTDGRDLKLAGIEESDVKGYVVPRA